MGFPHMHLGVILSFDIAILVYMDESSWFSLKFRVKGVVDDPFDSSSSGERNRVKSVINVVSIGLNK